MLKDYGQEIKEPAELPEQEENPDRYALFDKMAESFRKEKNEQKVSWLAETYKGVLKANLLPLAKAKTLKELEPVAPLFMLGGSSIFNPAFYVSFKDKEIDKKFNDEYSLDKLGAIPEEVLNAEIEEIRIDIPFLNINATFEIRHADTIPLNMAVYCSEDWDMHINGIEELIEDFIDENLTTDYEDDLSETNKTIKDYINVFLEAEDDLTEALNAYLRKDI